MDYLMISNWEKWQSYRKDRAAPPWIKIYRNLLTKSEWAVLTDGEKGALTSIWLVGAERGGRIPADPLLLRKVAQLDETPNVSKFIELGFIDATILTDDCHHDVKVTPESGQKVDPEVETEVEKEEQPPAFSPPTLTQLIEYMASRGYGLPQSKLESEKFLLYYQGRSWKTGKHSKPMVSWKLSVINWLKKVPIEKQTPTVSELRARGDL